jgi:hypothetical protein
MVLPAHSCNDGEDRLIRRRLLAIISFIGTTVLGDDGFLHYAKIVVQKIRFKLTTFALRARCSTPDIAGQVIKTSDYIWDVDYDCFRCHISRCGQREPLIIQFSFFVRQQEACLLDEIRDLIHDCCA